MTRPAVLADPTAVRESVPSWVWRHAPEGYATRRQLAAMGLRPGGQELAGLLLKPRSRVVAHLFRIDRALPKRTASPAWLAATRKATAARHICGGCEKPCDVIPPKRTGYRGPCCAP